MTLRPLRIWHWVVLAIFYILLCWWIFYPAPIRYVPEQPTAAERAYFKKRLKYHGLDKQFTVLIEEQGNLYFKRDGRSCRF